jgi:MFS family permease
MTNIVCLKRSRSAPACRGLLSQYRSIPGQARLLIYLSFIPSLALGFIYTDLSYFLTTVRGFSYLFMGMVITTMGISTVVASIPFGILADRYGRRKFMVVGNVLASITLATFALTTNEAAFSTAGTALLAEKAEDASRTSAFSLWSFLQNIAWGLGGFSIPLVLVIESLGLNSIESHISLYVALAILSLAVTPFLFRVDESVTSKKAKSISEFMPRKSKGVLVRYATTAVLIAFGAGFFVPLMTQWFRAAFGVPDTISGPVIGLSGFLIAGVTLAAPNLARKFGLVKSIVLTQTLSMVFMLAVPLSPTFRLAGTVYIIRTVIMNVSNPLTTSLIMGLVDKSERGAAAGLSTAIWRFPNSISTTLGSVMMGAGYLALPFYLASGLYIVSISLFWMFFRKSRPPEEAEVGVSSPPGTGPSLRRPGARASGQPPARLSA